MSRTPTEDDLARFVRNNVLCCLSSMVSTLASGYGSLCSDLRHGPSDTIGSSLGDLTEQAADLASPVCDYEEAATQEGWTLRNPSAIDGVRHFVKENESTFYSSAENTEEASWAALCDAEGIEPYEREVFEFWSVDSWFAEELIAQGEKVDTDFAGLCVWARTTSGQAISMDGVIKRIWRDLHKDDKSEG